MNINQTLSIIKERCNDFSNLPKTMEQNINKEELKNYLLETMKIDLIIINNFLDLIYDDNEEDKNNVPTNHFLEKYISLLKILDTNESEEDNKEKNQKDNSINEEEINKIEFGSPIRDNLINKYEDDNSIDPSELFKEMNFKNNYENNFQNNNFNSIIRPSNNFNFDTLKNLKITDDIIKKEIVQENNNDEKKINEKYKKIIKNHSNTNILNNIIHNQRHLSIKQKLQDVFFQIHKPNDIKRYNIHPVFNSKNYNSTQNIINKNKIFIPSPRKVDKDFFIQINNKINNLNHHSPSKKNNMNLYNNVKNNYKKINFRNEDINKKLKGLNDILFSKDIIKINKGNLFNSDNFYTLEDKINQFEKRKHEIKRKQNRITNIILDEKKENIIEK